MRRAVSRVIACKLKVHVLASVSRILEIHNCVLLFYFVLNYIGHTLTAWEAWMVRKAREDATKRKALRKQQVHTCVCVHVHVYVLIHVHVHVLVGTNLLCVRVEYL